MSTENHTEFSVNGLVIFDLNDLPEVSVTPEAITAGGTTIARTSAASLSYDELRDRSQELYAIALAVRDMQSSPELDRMIALLKENSAHTDAESREIALAMVQSGVSGGF